MQPPFSGGCNAERRAVDATLPVIVLAARATTGSADIKIGNLDVSRPNVEPVARMAIAAVTALVGIAAAFRARAPGRPHGSLVALCHE